MSEPSSEGRRQPLAHSDGPRGFGAQSPWTVGAHLAIANVSSKTLAKTRSRGTPVLVMQIALGIVIGVLVLRFLPEIIHGIESIFIFTILAALLVLVILNLKTAALVVLGLAVFVLGLGLPMWINAKIVKRYPSFGSLVKGTVPYDAIYYLPVRILVLTPYAILWAGISVAIFVSAIGGGEWLQNYMAK